MLPTAVMSAKSTPRTPCASVVPVTDRSDRRLAIAGAAAPALILVAAWGVFLVYAYPGYMSNDSFYALGEARAGLFTDAHPPVMAAEWRLLDQMVAGPFGMLVIQSVLFLGGFFVLLRRHLPAWKAALVAAALFLFPPILAPMAVIWKDCQMAAFVVAGTAAILSPRLPMRIVGLGLLVVGTAFRHNAPAAVLPLIVLLFVWRSGTRSWARYGASLAAGALVVVAASGVNRALTDQQSHYWFKLAYGDIVGTIRFSPPRPDEEWRQALTGVPMRQLTDVQAAMVRAYDPRSFAGLMKKGHDRIFLYPHTPADLAAIGAAWKRVVLGHKAAYLAHRWHAYAPLLGLSGPLEGPVFSNFGTEAQRREFRIAARASAIQRAFAQGMRWLSRTGLFQPFIYVLLNLMLLVLARRDRLVWAILASGLAYEAALFFVAPAPDYRYSHWLIVCTCLGFATLVLRGQVRPSRFVSRWWRRLRPARPAPSGDPSAPA